MTPAQLSDLPVVIIGAGPVGLAAAAQLLAREAKPLVLEAGPEVGYNIRQWGHVGMFTPWRFCVDHAAEALLAAHGWTHPPRDAVPTGADLVTQYLNPLAAALEPYIEFNACVVAVARKGSDKVRSAGRGELPFVLRVQGPRGEMRRIEARAVIDASGTWGSPNPMGADGLPAIGEENAAAHIATGIPDVLGSDRARYAGKATAVIGSGHSALNALIELSALRREIPGTEIFWLLRKERVEAAFGGETADALPERGALGSQARALVESGTVKVLTPFRVAELVRVAGKLRIEGEHAGASAAITVDEIIVTTGFRPDFSMLREIRLALDPWLESAGTIGPLIDPNLHSCGTVRPHGANELAHPEPDFFIAGMKSYGRAPTFLLATGHEQVRSIAAALTGDHEAATRVELDLPETGVCSARPANLEIAAASACCTTETPQGVCCPPKPELSASAACCAGPSPAKETASACCAVSEQAAS
jgi:thioredoxin reductase